MSRATQVFMRCAVAVALAVVVGGALRPRPLCAQTAADARAACEGDRQNLCANVPPGGGRLIACLKQHQSQVSDGCKRALGIATRGSGGGAGSGAVAPAASPTPQPAAPSQPALPPPSSSTSPKHGAATASAGPGSYLVLKKAQIMVKYDDVNEALSPAIDLLIPSNWNFQGAIHMYGAKTGCFSEAFSVFWQAKSPDGATIFQGIPNFAWQYSDDPQELHNLTDTNRRTHTGNKTNDLCAVAKPMNAEQYFRQAVLKDLTPAMTVESIESYPALEQLVRQHDGLPPANSGNGGARIDAIRVRLAFQKDNQPMELWYSLALVTQTYRVGRGFLYDIHAVGQAALGAPKGKLDGNEKLFKAVMSSIQPTVRYATYTNKWIAYYYQIQANKEAQMDRIQADVDRAITQTYQHMSDNAQRVSDIGFHANDQNLRDVQTYRDPSTGREMELSNQYNHAWLNGNNQYVMSDDPSFNPNVELNGNWTQLQTVQP